MWVLKLIRLRSQRRQKNTEEKQQQAEQQVAELKQRDSEVRAHEQAHASLGAQNTTQPKI